MKWGDHSEERTIAEEEQLQNRLVGVLAKELGGDDEKASGARKEKASKQKDDDYDDDDDEDDDYGPSRPLPGFVMPDVLPSVGSAGHGDGTCKRCCFFPKGRCENGEKCDFCHFEHEKRKRLNKKKKKKSKQDEGDGEEW